MAIFTNIPPARALSDQQISYISGIVTVAADGIAVLIGTIPAGSVILPPITGTQTNEVFNDTTTAVITIGTAASPAAFASGLDVKTLGFAAASEATAAYSLGVDVVVYATYTGGTGDGTTGSSQVIVNYVRLITG